MDASTEELRAAHDVLSEFYAERLAARGLAPRGVDLSPEMIRVARREQPGFEYEVADLREPATAASGAAGAPPASASSSTSTGSHRMRWSAG